MLVLSVDARDVRCIVGAKRDQNVHVLEHHVALHRVLDTDVQLHKVPCKAVRMLGVDKETQPFHRTFPLPSSSGQHVIFSGKYDSSCVLRLHRKKATRVEGNGLVGSYKTTSLVEARQTIRIKETNLETQH